MYNKNIFITRPNFYYKVELIIDDESIVTHRTLSKRRAFKYAKRWKYAYVAKINIDSKIKSI